MWGGPSTRCARRLVEPVFGQTRECRGFRRFSFRGLENVRAEWQLVCLTPQHPEVVSLRRRIQATGGLNRSREILANTESADDKYVSRSMGAAAISSHGSV